MNRLSTAERVAMLAAMVEGNSLRAITRLVGVTINTVTKFLIDLGTVCEAFHNEHVRNVKATCVEADQAWTFCCSGCEKARADKTVTLDRGDVWTWVGLCADSKLALGWTVGTRDADTAYAFMHSLASRLSSRVQLGTDGPRVYLNAVESPFQSDIDYGKLMRVYGVHPKAGLQHAASVRINAEAEVVSGNPENLTMRVSRCRPTRLTDRHSKKIANHCRALAIHYVHYNFAQKQGALGGTPAMAAGLVHRVWPLGDIVGLLEAAEK